MTYLIEQLDKQQIPYIEISLSFTDAKTDLILSEVILCSVRCDDKQPKFDISNSTDPLQTYLDFCDLMFDNWKQHGLQFGAYFWRDKKVTVTQLLNNWNRLIQSNDVIVNWVTKNTYKLETISKRSYR